jgi:hypothetical protein
MIPSAKIKPDEKTYSPNPDRHIISRHITGICPDWREVAL